MFSNLAVHGIHRFPPCRVPSSLEARDVARTTSKDCSIFWFHRDIREEGHMRHPDGLSEWVNLKRPISLLPLNKLSLRTPHPGQGAYLGAWQVPLLSQQRRVNMFLALMGEHVKSTRITPPPPKNITDLRRLTRNHTRHKQSQTAIHSNQNMLRTFGLQDRALRNSVTLLKWRRINRHLLTRNEKNNLACKRQTKTQRIETHRLKSQPAGPQCSRNA